MKSNKILFILLFVGFITRSVFSMMHNFDLDDFYDACSELNVDKINETVAINPEFVNILSSDKKGPIFAVIRNYVADIDKQAEALESLLSAKGVNVNRVCSRVGLQYFTDGFTEELVNFYEDKNKHDYTIFDILLVFMDSKILEKILFCNSKETVDSYKREDLLDLMYFLELCLFYYDEDVSIEYVKEYFSEQLEGKATSFLNHKLRILLDKFYEKKLKSDEYHIDEYFEDNFQAVPFCGFFNYEDKARLDADLKEFPRFIKKIKLLVGIESGDPDEKERVSYLLDSNNFTEFDDRPKFKIILSELGITKQIFPIDSFKLLLRSVGN